MNLASSPTEASRLNLLARSTLLAAGRLAGPTVTAGELELRPGDWVVAGPGGIGRPEGSGILHRQHYTRAHFGGSQR